MKKITEITASEITKTPNRLRRILEDEGIARIVWKERRPGGDVEMSAIVKVEYKK